MRISVLQENLKRGLATVGHAVAGKTTLPVLSNVLLATDGGRLKLAATNLEIGITHWIGAKVEEEGAITVPAKLLADVISGLPNDKVILTLDARTQTVKVDCARFTNNIKGIEADEFPAIPTVSDREPTATLPPQLLREAIDQVAFAAASDDSRPVLAGVLVRLRESQVILAAADGFRLATRTMLLPEPIRSAQEFIVPARALSELSRIIGDTEGLVSITVTPGGGQVLFHTETTDLVTRLIDGKFPDFERIIPAQHLTRTVLETQELMKAVKLASFFAVNSQNVVKLTLEPGGDLAPGHLVISANAAEVGDNRGELDAMIHGDGGQIALNVKYLGDALAAMKTAQVALETQTAQSPGVLKPVGQDGYVHIIMPMSIR
ncbi:DNA polymerase III subunit beta [Candidatus Gracilibacteria bacterium]|nr:DNA polymerase III subunit beta [Candidatus Gracilibacteria bacterium]